jgi:hypothetical protein
MNKKDLNKMAIIGLASGILAGCGSQDATKSDTPSPMDHMGEKVTSVSEEHLLSQLNESSRALFKSLGNDAKATVLRVASSKCAGENPCAGLNGCKTANNECAGMASCKGHGGCAVDANTAVKLVVKKLAEERSKIDY